jgi:hypothetical protein
MRGDLMKRGRVGQTLLAVWLIIVGLQWAIGLHFSGLAVLQGILALVAGILLLMGL